MGAFNSRYDGAMRALNPDERAKQHLEQVEKLLRELSVYTRSIGDVYGRPLGLELSRRIEHIDEQLGEAYFHLREADAAAEDRFERLARLEDEQRRRAEELTTVLARAVSQFDGDDSRSKLLGWVAPAKALLNRYGQEVPF